MEKKLKNTAAAVSAGLLGAAVAILFLVPDTAVFAGLWVAGLCSTVVYLRLARQGRTVGHASRMAKYL